MLSLLFSLSALAGDGPWRTLETEHFRVHYPDDAEAYATNVVRHLEEARERNEAVVGRTEDRVVDVVIQDPAATANGMALPFRGRPRMVLWTTPPTSDSVLSNYRDPFEDLVVHEDLHLVHLLTPPRGGVDKVIWTAVGLGPIARKAPRWLSEGYATVVEGQLTGFGRPHGDYRAALLRVLAEEGRLPTYGELNGTGRFEGYGFAYLVGSAYIEWLLQRTDPEAFQRLWKRMSSANNRSFEEAFDGVFGDRPFPLYARFRAEITAAAMEQTREPHDDLYFERDNIVADPAISPNGKRIAMVEQIGNRRLFALSVYATVPWDRIVQRRKLRLSRAQDRDPEDVPAIDDGPDPHERIKRRLNISRPARYPRWISNDKLLYEAVHVSPGGRRVTDLYQLDLVGKDEQRLTFNANLRRADPGPRGGWAIAVQADWGATRLVKVNLKKRGAIIPLTEYAVDTVVDVPRVSPDGSRAVFLQQRDGSAFRPYLIDLKSREITPVELPDGVHVADPEWSDDGHLVFGVGRKGVFEIAELELETGRWRTLTETGGRARSPSINDDELVFLQLHALGYDVAKTNLEGVKDTVPSGRPPIVPPPPPPDVPAVTGSGEVPEARHYGFGRPEFRPLISGVYGAGGGFGQLEFGLREGDVIGRHETLVLGSVGTKGGYTGIGGAFAWRALPVDLLVHGSAGQQGQLDTVAAGGVLSVERIRGAYGMRARLGFHGRMPPGESEVSPVGTLAGQAWVTHDARRSRSISVSVRVEQGLEPDSFAREVAPRLTWRSFQLSYRLGQRGGHMPYQLGGAPSSLVAPDLRWNWVGGPGFGAPRSLQGTTTLHDAELRWGLSGFAPFARYVRLDDRADRLESALAGFELNVGSGPQPLVAVPAQQLSIGVACQVMKPEEQGFDPTWCRDLEDYTAWVDLRWGL